MFGLRSFNSEQFSAVIILASAVDAVVLISVLILAVKHLNTLDSINLSIAIYIFPGTLVISAYVGCPDVALTVTPDLKCPGGKGRLSRQVWYLFARMNKMQKILRA